MPTAVVITVLVITILVMTVLVMTVLVITALVMTVLIITLPVITDSHLHSGAEDRGDPGDERRPGRSPGMAQQEETQSLLRSRGQRQFQGRGSEPTAGMHS